jgi:hypothetical protein
LNQEDNLMEQSSSQGPSVWTGRGVVAALELRLADEDAAVGVDAGAELELEGEVLGKLLRGVERGDEPLLALGEVDGEDAIAGRVSPRIAGLGLAVELLGDVADPGGVAIRLGAEAPAGEVFAVEQALETGGRLPDVGMNRGRERDPQEGDERAEFSRA